MRSRPCCPCPGGVFNPYSGVKTSVLAFRKGGATGRVMFLHADNDGFKLDANHDQAIDEDDLPDLTEAFRDRDSRWEEWQERDPGCRMDGEMVVRRGRRDSRRQLQPERQSSPPAEPDEGRASQSAGDFGRIACHRNGNLRRDRRAGRGGTGSPRLNEQLSRIAAW